MPCRHARELRIDRLRRTGPSVTTAAGEATLVFATPSPEPPGAGAPQLEQEGAQCAVVVVAAAEVEDGTEEDLPVALVVPCAPTPRATAQP